MAVAFIVSLPRPNPLLPVNLTTYDKDHRRALHQVRLKDFLLHNGFFIVYSQRPITHFQPGVMSIYIAFPFFEEESFLPHPIPSLFGKMFS